MRTASCEKGRRWPGALNESWLDAHYVQKMPDPPLSASRRGSCRNRRGRTRVSLVFHATRDESIGGEAWGLAHFRAVAQGEAIEFISTMELYARACKSNLPPHYDDIHLSKDGARILAERLAIPTTRR